MMEFNDILDISPDRIRHRLKDSIDMRRLMDGEGVTFEVDGPAPFMADDEIQRQEEECGFQDRDFLDDLNACGFFDETDAQGVEVEEEEMDSKARFARLKSKMTDITDGMELVYKRVLKTGQGELIPTGALVYYHYRLYLEDGLMPPEPFDSTRFRRRMECQCVGNNTILEGMELALLSMKKGERADFLMSYQVMYGISGCPPRIPEKANIYAEMEVVDFVMKDQMESYFDMDQEEREQLSYDQVREVMVQCRRDAQTAYQNRRYAAALRKYRRARDVLESVFVKDEEEEERRKVDLLKILKNIAICLKKLNKMPLCITICNDILALDPEEPKAHYFKGVALTSLSEFQQATACLRTADRLQPNHPEILKAVEENNRKASKHLQYMRVMCGRMFGSDTPPEPPKKEVPLDLDCAFAKRLNAKLEDFVSDSSVISFPEFDTKSYNVEEVAILTHLAKSKNLQIVINRDSPHLWSIRKRV